MIFLNSNEILFGTGKIQKIVSVSYKNGCIFLFLENKPGEIEVKKVEFNPYFFSNKKGKESKYLLGNLEYKYLNYFKIDNLNEINLIKFKEYHKDDVFFIRSLEEQYLISSGETYFKGLQIEDISIFSIDIETTSLSPDENSLIILISTCYKKGDFIEKKIFSYEESEKKMLIDFINYFKNKNPSIIIGHNIFNFDLHFIYKKCIQHDVKFDVGRDGSEIYLSPERGKFRKEANQTLVYKKFKIFGREIIDTLFLSIKHDISTRKYENYGLKHIIEKEGLNVENRVFYDASLIRFNYKDKKEFEKIKEYCLHDAYDALNLFKYLIPPYFSLSKIIPKTFQALIESASGSQLNSLMLRNYFYLKHSIPKPSEKIDYEGAISLGNPGIYKNALKFDVTSLYPSIMLTYNIYDKKKDPYNILLEILKELRSKRIEYKNLFKKTNNKDYDNQQAAMKILINSMYGFLGAPYLNFNSPENAALVTKYGREILNKAFEWCEKKGFYLINADTDSILFNKIKEESFSNEEIENLLNDINSLYDKNIKMEFDGYYKSALVLKAKNYCLLKHDGEYIKKGSGVKTSNKEIALKELTDELLKSLMNGENKEIEIYLKYINEALNLKDIKRWSFKRSITSNVINFKRTNEKKIMDAIEDHEYQEGDKKMFFYLPDGKLSLTENFNGEYDKIKLLEKVYKTVKIFDSVLDISKFEKFFLKKNSKKIEGL